MLKREISSLFLGPQETNERSPSYAMSTHSGLKRFLFRYISNRIESATFSLARLPLLLAWVKVTPLNIFDHATTILLVVFFASAFT